MMKSLSSFCSCALLLFYISIIAYTSKIHYLIQENSFQQLTYVHIDSMIQQIYCTGQIDWFVFIFDHITIIYIFFTVNLSRIIWNPIIWNNNNNNIIFRFSYIFYDVFLAFYNRIIYLNSENVVKISHIFCSNKVSQCFFSSFFRCSQT